MEGFQRQKRSVQNRTSQPFERSKILRWIVFSKAKHQHFDDYQNRPNHYSFRRFIKATDNTPLEYAQRVKIESAKKAFETSRKKINEVMYEVGYVDVKAFREVFRKMTGM